MAFTKAEAKEFLERFAKIMGVPVYESQLEAMADLITMPEHMQKAAFRRMREPIDIKRLTFVP